ncbi:MAG: hypothetical protein PUK40_00745 [Actinomycetaceae bacterium]|nr:hypothetical protein [Arcanobacterium sp.]MDD7504467.1 hypothetical protein [Actinomycetaceae bacterium]MDY6143975.1 hypothetical protein [Arcanobacterium sp.]
MVKDPRTLWLAGFLISFCLGMALAFTGAALYRQDAIAIDVSGELGAEVSISAAGRIDVDTLTVREEITGEGRTLEEDSQILYAATSYSYTPGFTPELNEPTSLYSGTARPADLGSISSGIIGKNEGSREVIIVPNTAQTSAEILVIDILPTVLLGEMQAPANSALPAVTLDESLTPAIAAPSTTISNLEFAPLIVGRGVQVDEESTIYANYVSIDESGAERENTYVQEAPTLLEVSKLMPGLRDALVNARIGSRIEIAIPAGQAQGDTGVVVVMDLLASVPSQPDSREGAQP